MRNRKGGSEGDQCRTGPGSVRHVHALRDAADVLAERMRALGATAPGSFTEFMELAEIKDHEPVKDSTDMVRILADGHETAARIMCPLVEACEMAGDSGTADLVTERLLSHAKHAWMLRAMMSSRTLRFRNPAARWGARHVRSRHTPRTAKLDVVHRGLALLVLLDAHVSVSVVDA